MPSSVQQDSARRVADHIEAAHGGSQQALGWLLERYRHYLLRVARTKLHGRLQSKCSGADLVQETFLEAQRIFDRFQGASSRELLAWLQAILQNKLATFTRQYQQTGKRNIAREVSLDHERSTEDTTSPEPVAAGPTPSSQIVLTEQIDSLRDALERLPEHYRQVIHWRQWEELPFEEIARRLDRSVDAARMLWWRAIDRLHKELEASG